MDYTDWTQRRLAEVCDVHPSTVSTWATGQVRTPGAVRALLAMVGKARQMANGYA